MQEVAAVLLTCSLHASLCSLLDMSWHVLDYVSICSGTSVVSKFSTAKPVPPLLESIEAAIFSNKRELK